MFSSSIYLYQQRHRVMLVDTSANLTSKRYQIVYSKNLKLNKGTDNVLIFTFINQDQKPVNITSSTFTFRIINREGGSQLLAKDLTTVSATTGSAKVIITEQELESVSAQKANYSIERSTSDSDLFETAFVDDNCGGRGVIEILDSTYPSSPDSLDVTIPTHGDDTSYYSSQWQGTSAGLQTLQYKPTVFTGSLTIQGAVDTSGQWYSIGSATSLTASSTTGYVNITGYHPYLKLYIQDVTAGSISSISLR